MPRIQTEPHDDAVAFWEAHWTDRGDFGPVACGERRFLSPSRCLLAATPYTTADAAAFAARWEDILAAEELAAEAARRLWSWGYRAHKGLLSPWGEGAIRTHWRTASDLAAPSFYRVTTLWSEMVYYLYDGATRTQPWWDRWRAAPSPIEKVRVQAAAWDVLAERGQCLRGDRGRNHAVVPTADTNPFTPLLAMYRLGVGVDLPEVGSGAAELVLQIPSDPT